MTLELVFWDVQHGSATYVKTPNGKHLVQDLGTGSYESSDKEFSPLLYLKNKYQVAQLDLVTITHPHRDHIYDVVNFDELSPRALLRPKHLPKEEILKNVERRRDAFSDALVCNENSLVLLIVEGVAESHFISKLQYVPSQ